MTTYNELNKKIVETVQLAYPDMQNWQTELQTKDIPVGLAIQINIEIHHQTLRQVVESVKQIDNHATASIRYQRWQRQLNNAYRHILSLPADINMNKADWDWLKHHQHVLISALADDAKKYCELGDVQYYTRLGAMIQIFSIFNNEHEEHARRVQIRSMYRTGLTSREIIEQTGYLPRIVSEALKDLDDASRLARRNRNILKKYIRTGSVRKVAKYYHLGITTVTNIIKQEAKQPTMEAVRQHYHVVVSNSRRRFSQEEINSYLNQAVEFLQQNGPQTMQRIAEEVNMTYASLRRWVENDERFYYTQTTYPHMVGLRKQEND